jgi:hypothetical protein
MRHGGAVRIMRFLSLAAILSALTGFVPLPGARHASAARSDGCNVCSEGYLGQWEHLWWEQYGIGTPPPKA